MKEWLTRHRAALFGCSGWAYAAGATFVAMWQSAPGWLWALPIVGALWLAGVVAFVAWINGPVSERIEREEERQRYSDPDRAYGAPW